jgi:hypothetical protein
LVRGLWCGDRTHFVCPFPYRWMLFLVGVLWIKLSWCSHVFVFISAQYLNCFSFLVCVFLKFCYFIFHFNHTLPASN